MSIILWNLIYVGLIVVAIAVVVAVVLAVRAYNRKRSDSNGLGTPESRGS